jgi:hypothetical protein
MTDSGADPYKITRRQFALGLCATLLLGPTGCAQKPKDMADPSQAPDPATEAQQKPKEPSQEEKELAEKIKEHRRQTAKEIYAKRAARMIEQGINPRSHAFFIYDEPVPGEYRYAPNGERYLLGYVTPGGQVAGYDTGGAENEIHVFLRPCTISDIKEHGVASYDEKIYTLDAAQKLHEQAMTAWSVITQQKIPLGAPSAPTDKEQTTAAQTPQTAESKTPAEPQDRLTEIATASDMNAFYYKTRSFSLFRKTRQFLRKHTP